MSFDPDDLASIKAAQTVNEAKIVEIKLALGASKARIDASNDKIANLAAYNAILANLNSEKNATKIAMTVLGVSSMLLNDGDISKDEFIDACRQLINAIKLHNDQLSARLILWQVSVYMIVILLISGTLAWLLWHYAPFMTSVR